MRVFLILIFLFSVNVHAARMNYVQAYNVVHGLLAQIPLKAAQHAQVEQALGKLKVLVAEQAKKDAASVKKAKDDAVIKKYLESKKAKPLKTKGPALKAKPKKEKKDG